MKKRAGRIRPARQITRVLEIDLASASAAKKIYAHRAESSQCNKGPGRRLRNHVEGEGRNREVELTTSKIVGLRRIAGRETSSENAVGAERCVRGDGNSYSRDEVTGVGGLREATG